MIVVIVVTDTTSCQICIYIIINQQREGGGVSVHMSIRLLRGI